MAIGGFSGNFKNLILCKYAKIISYSVPVECLYHVPPGGYCPKDSGTNGKCNHECYKYEVVRDD